MTKLLRMEYILNRRQVLLTMGILSLYFVILASWTASPRVYLVTASLMIGLALPFGMLGREDKFKTAALVCSLPVRRSLVVLAKYASTWILIAAGLGYATALTVALPFTKVAAGDILTLKSLFVSLFLISVFFSFMLPFTTRFGLTGIIVFLVAGQVLGIITMIAAQLIGGRANPLNLAIRAVENGLRRILYHAPTPGYFLALAAAILALNAASFLTARALYLHRDL
jgi:ABC-type transport system involved in multi-copper enzyme maturation permease subunit